MYSVECVTCGVEMPMGDVVHVCSTESIAKEIPEFVEPVIEKVPMWKLGIMIHGYRLVQTCSACPEQYDVFDDLGQQVAYFRLRHGGFTVSVPDVGGDQVYRANPKGDEWSGVFYDDERVKYLTEGILAVQEYYINRRWSVDFE
jgi:hypothetical protein